MLSREDQKFIRLIPLPWSWGQQKLHNIYFFGNEYGREETSFLCMVPKHSILRCRFEAIGRTEEEILVV